MPQEGTFMNLGYTKGTAMLDDKQCPDCKRINEVLSRVGDRWSVLVVISLAEYGTLRFNELKRNLGISQRMLSLTLKELERDGLVTRTQFNEIPPRVEYDVTETAVTLIPVLETIAEWTTSHSTTLTEVA